MRPYHKRGPGTVQWLDCLGRCGDGMFSAAMRLRYPIDSITVEGHYLNKRKATSQRALAIVARTYRHHTAGIEEP
jgi:hypothetical protein